ncbi:peptidase inhibitor family I36 protein [Saccharothrix sp. AJ9571]|nr:peptidase inhibitor family I36 protein [Saccharothrix sp. AJ9571]
MRVFTGLWTALGLAAVGAVVPATTAQAAPAAVDGDVSITAYSDCPSGWFCVWEHADGQGRMARFQIGTPHLGNYNLNDQVSSVWNRTSSIWCTYLDIDYGGAGWRVSSGWRGNTSLYDRNDNISSLRDC